MRSVGDDLVGKECMNQTEAGFTEGARAIEVFTEHHRGLDSQDVVSCPWPHEADEQDVNNY